MTTLLAAHRGSARRSRGAALPVGCGRDVAPAGRGRSGFFRRARPGALPGLRPPHAVPLGAGRRHAAPRRRGPRREARRLRPRRTIRRALSLRVRGDGVGGPRPRGGPRPALRAEGARAAPLRAQRPAQPGDRRAPRGLAPALPREAVGEARPRAPRPRRRSVRRGPIAADVRRLAEPALGSRDGAWVAVSTNPTLIPFAGTRARRGIPAAGRGAGVAPPRARVSADLRSPRRPAARDVRLGEAVSGFEIRDAAAADAPGIRRLFQKVFGTALSEEEWSWKFAQDPDGWYGVVGIRAMTARSSATMPAGARGSCWTGSRACSTRSATSPRIRRCAASADGAASTGRWPTRSTRGSARTACRSATGFRTPGR